MFKSKSFRIKIVEVYSSLEDSFVTENWNLTFFGKLVHLSILFHQEAFPWVRPWLTDGCFHTVLMPRAFKDL
jgi:hypothetical protein